MWCSSYSKDLCHIATSWPRTSKLRTYLQTCDTHSCSLSKTIGLSFTTSLQIAAGCYPFLCLLPHHRRSSKSRFRYNIIIDPWLSGPQIDYYSWFSLQTHASPAAIPSIAALEQLLEEIEKLSAELVLKDDQASSSEKEDQSEKGSLIDAVVVSHEFTGIYCGKTKPIVLYPRQY